MSNINGSKGLQPYRGLPAEIRSEIWLYSHLIQKQQKQDKIGRVQPGLKHPLINVIRWAFSRLQHNFVGSLLVRLFATLFGLKGFPRPQTSTVMSLLLANRIIGAEATGVFQKQTSYRVPPGPTLPVKAYFNQIPTYQRDLISTVTVRFCAADYQGPLEWGSHHLSTSRRVMASESLQSAWCYRAIWLDKLIWVSKLPGITKIIIELEGMDETFYFEGRDSIQRVFGGVAWQPRSADPHEGWPPEFWDLARLASDNVAEMLYTREMVDAGLEVPVVSRWRRMRRAAPVCYRLAA